MNNRQRKKQAKRRAPSLRELVTALTEEHQRAKAAFLQEWQGDSTFLPSFKAALRQLPTPPQEEPNA